MDRERDTGPVPHDAGSRVRARLVIAGLALGVTVFFGGTWLAPFWTLRGEPIGGWLTLAYAPLCHQEPDRSLHYGAARQAVCARCSGLYAGGGIGLVAGLFRVGRGRGPRGKWFVWLAVPTLVDAVLPWVGLPNLPNVPRWWLALPLGVVAGLLLARGVEELFARRRPLPLRPDTAKDENDRSVSHGADETLEVLDG